MMIVVNSCCLATDCIGYHDYIVLVTRVASDGDVDGVVVMVLTRQFIAYLSDDLTCAQHILTPCKKNGAPMTQGSACFKLVLICVRFAYMDSQHDVGVVCCMVRINTGLGMQILLEIQRNPADISITRMENVFRIKGKKKEQGTFFILFIFYWEHSPTKRHVETNTRQDTGDVGTTYRCTGSNSTDQGSRR